MKSIRPCLFVLLSCFLQVCISCKSPAFECEVLKKDRPYFLALKKENEGNTFEAKRLFSVSAKKSTPYIARQSAEKLTQIGNVQERLNAASLLVKKYQDEQSLLIAVKLFFEYEEYTKVLRLTENLKIETSLNSLLYYRFSAMLKNNNSRLLNDVYTWFISRAFSAEHYKFYCDISKIEEFKSFEKAKIIDFRAEVYKKNYKTGYEKFILQKDDFPVEAQIISDIGKTCLYGSEEYLKNAEYFSAMAKKYSKTNKEFYLNFYSARLYEKADYLTLATSKYKSAMLCASSDELYDNALWYLLSLNLKKSTSQGIKMIKEYCKNWHNPAYFDDIFDTLSPLMLSEGRWNEFYELYKAIDGFATDSTTAKFAYIYGRLVQEKLALPVIGDTHKSEDAAAFTRSLTSGNDVYYKVLALSRLGFGGIRAEEVLCNMQTDSEKTEESEKDENAEAILNGYVYFGFPEKIYPEWQKLNKEGYKISYETGIRLARFLQNCGNNKNEYYPQALRIASKTINSAKQTVSKEDLKLLYPKDYSELIQEKCKKYNVPEEIMYALVRSESFFDFQIESSAGAVGLTQLMTFTGSDIAHRLKYKEFDLKNPNDNLEFGTWYLNNLASRLENNWLSSFFAYNAGITRVRRWIKSSKIAFNNIKKLPDDLFLEIIPYSETREYGRKLVGAAAMYAWLYYDMEISEKVLEIIE